MESPKYIAYYRVSTKQQGSSGLGLDAQREQVQRFVNCCDCILAEYTDIESGKVDNRPELLKAIEHANNIGAKLVIAKLDRLSRNAAFIFTLKDRKVDFVCADMPEANTLTIGIFATLAQHERELISQRTKAALQARKDRGMKLGKPENMDHEAQKKGAKAMKDKAKANENNKRGKGYVVALRSQGLGWSEIARTLNNEGFRTAKGKAFQAVQVQRLYNRATA